jgi:hypothetical protein
MENQTKPKSQSLLYGAVYGIFSSLALYLFYKLDLEMKGISSLIHFSLATICVLLPINLYKNSNANQLTIANALKIGLFVGLIGGIIYAVYAYMHFEFINPEFLTEKMAQTKAELETQNTELTQEQMNQALKFAEIFVSPIVISITGFIGALLETFITALVIGLIKRSN